MWEGRIFWEGKGMTEREGFCGNDWHLWVELWRNHKLLDIPVYEATERKKEREEVWVIGWYLTDRFILLSRFLVVELLNNSPFPSVTKKISNMAFKIVENNVIFWSMHSKIKLVKNPHPPYVLFPSLRSLWHYSMALLAPNFQKKWHFRDPGSDKLSL